MKYKAYAEYKDSGVEWLGAIPKHWATSKLRYMFSFSKGLTITKEDLTDEGVPCVNYGEVHSKYGFEVDPAVHPLKCVSEDYLKSSPSALLSRGDFVFADTSEDIEGSGNFTQLTSEQPIFAGYHTIIARPVDRGCSRFYAYLLDSLELRTQIRHAVKGVKVFSVTQAILRGVNIWLPGLEERKKIANFLDYETAKIDTLIEKQQQLIKLLKEKRQAVISHAVTKGLNPNAPMKDSGVEWLGDVPAHWKTGSLRWFIKIASGEGLSNTEIESVRDKLSRFRVVGGNGTMGYARKTNTKNLAYAIGRVGALCGNVHFISDPCWITDNALKISAWEQFDNEYLFFLLVASGLNDYASKSAQPLITGEQVKSLQVSIPPEKEQAEIGEYIRYQLDKFSKLISKNELAINLLKERRTSLISAAVTGKIDVRNHQ